MTAIPVSVPLDVRHRSRTGVTALSYIFGAFGAIALVTGTIQVGRILAGPASVVSPVFANSRRLPHLETLERLATGYTANFLILAGWFVFALLLGILLLALVHALYRHAPFPSIVAGVLLAGSVIAAVLVGTSEMKVVEFAVQSTGASPAEKEWVGSGMNFLNQLHLFYVSAWMLFVGLGWIALGMSASAVRPRLRPGVTLVMAGGVILTVSVTARAWLPGYGPEAPSLAVAMGEPLASVGIGAGLLGCTLLWHYMKRTDVAQSENQP